MTIAARLLYERIQSGEFPIDRRVQEMVSQLSQEPVVAIRLHPNDLEILKQRVDTRTLSSSGTEIPLIPDPSLARGECQVEGRDTLLISDITRQLEEIRNELMRSLGHAGT